jgi:hypothetical protein
LSADTCPANNYISRKLYGAPSMDALATRGYRAGRAMVWMRRGESTGYDRTAAHYCDNWL